MTDDQAQWQAVADAVATTMRDVHRLRQELVAVTIGRQDATVLAGRVDALTDILRPLYTQASWWAAGEVR